MEEFSQEQHIMLLDITYESGSEEWCCPTCGRRLLIQWQPSFNWMILNDGDEHATHTGAKGELKIENSQVALGEESFESENEAPPLTEEEQKKLQPWIDWMEKTGFDNLWEKED